MRRVLTMAAVCALLGGCARVLGIDGEYSLDESRATASSGAGGADTTTSAGGAAAMTALRDAGAGGAGDIGVAVVAAGGGGVQVVNPPDGGSEAPPEAAPPPGAGGAAPDVAAPRSPCSPGEYEGTFTGLHDPTPSFVASLQLPLQIPVGGLVHLRMDRTSDDAVLAVTGTFRPDPSAPLGFIASFGADISGKFDCSALSLSGALTNGKFMITAFPFQFAGILGGKIDGGASTLSGAWSEEETPAPAPPATVGNGAGTWTVTWKGP
jgi:hypothetical protein